MSLDNLPFPIEELSWDKLAAIQGHLKLCQSDAEIVLTKVLGPRPDAPEAPWSGYAVVL